MTRRVGLYSGTFDPVHQGHLAFAKEAMRTCALDEVVFLPEQKPRGKSGVTDIAHRTTLIECATADYPGVCVARLDSEQFTIARTLPELHTLYRDSLLTFLIGSDVARSLQYWEDIATLLSSASLAIGMRSGDTSREIQEIMDELATRCAAPVSYTLVYTPEADISSSLIRSGSTDMSRLPAEMLSYIQHHKLYE